MLSEETKEMKIIIDSINIQIQLLNRRIDLLTEIVKEHINDSQSHSKTQTNGKVKP